MSIQTTQFTSQKTDIPDLLIFNVSNVGDERGYFQEKFHKEKLINAGLPGNFEPVQTNVSFNKEVGVTRGYHAEPWDKYISVVTGKVFSAYLDLRTGESFGKIVTVEIDQGIAIFLPQGVANSFQTIEPNTYYLYHANKHWSPDAYNTPSFVSLFDPTLKVNWAIDLDRSIISERDKNHPNLSEIKPL